MRFYRLSRVAILLFASLCKPALAADLHVSPGQSIQSVIDVAKRGDRVVVASGTYGEYLTISKSDIHLVGKNVTLVQPTDYPLIGNGCRKLAGPSTDAAICIIGADVVLADYEDGDEHRKVISTGRSIKDVSVEGFTISGFFGLAIAIVNAKDTVIRRNTFIDNPYYGILSLSSTGSIMTRNVVYASDVFLIGIGVDDSPNAHITQNTITGYTFGVAVDTNRADVSHNTIFNTCRGIRVDHGVVGTTILHNDIASTGANFLCALVLSSFPAGVYIDGANKNEVKHNNITDTRDGGDPPGPAYGIALLNDAAGNQITHNTLAQNYQDLLVQSAKKNEVAHNKCSTPNELCNK